MATRVLIVDDDQDIRKLLGHRLKSDGFEPIFAGDAISAVKPFDYAELLSAIRKALGHPA